VAGLISIVKLQLQLNSESEKLHILITEQGDKTEISSYAHFSFVGLEPDIYTFLGNRPITDSYQTHLTLQNGVHPQT
jgi:hypothetical protein